MNTLNGARAAALHGRAAGLARVLSGHLDGMDIAAPSPATTGWFRQVAQTRTPKQFGKVLSALQQRHGVDLSFREMAARTGVPESTLHNYLRGKTLPSGERLDQLLELFGATPDEAKALRDAHDQVDDQRQASRTRRQREPYPGGTPWRAWLTVIGNRRTATVAIAAAAALLLIVTTAVVTYQVTNTGTPTPTCADIGMVVRHDDPRWADPFQQAYQRAGGHDELGCPLPNGDGFVHSWAPGLSQDLYGGRSGNARIMALDETRIVVMSGRYWRDYTSPFGNRAASIMGYPTSDPITCGPAKIVLLEGGAESPGALVTSPDGTYIWLRQAAWQLYQQLGGPQGPLGQPQTGLGNQFDGTIHFEHGTIRLADDTAQVQPSTLTPPTAPRCP